MMNDTDIEDDHAALLNEDNSAFDNHVEMTEIKEAKTDNNRITPNSWKVARKGRNGKNNISKDLTSFEKWKTNIFKAIIRFCVLGMPGYVFIKITRLIADIRTGALFLV